MNLQPLYDVKDRLEHAAIAGTGLIPEDFRLRRAADNLKPLAQASPVFARLSAGLETLLTASPEERGGQLLDVLALADAIAYTQGSTGMAGDLTDLPAGGGTYVQISCGQIQPLLTALTTTGSGRAETVKSAWEVHPEHFTDFRVLPALISGLGDSYGEMADQNAKILKELGPVVVPLLKKDLDPAGNRAMARRVEVISAVEGAEATPWLRSVLPEAKKDVREAVITALGADPENTGLLLDLVKSERGKNREAVLRSLSGLDWDAAKGFWAEELAKNSDSVKFLHDTDTDWAAELVASGLRARVEKMLSDGKVTPKDSEDFTCWCYAIGRKTAPAMLEFWQWACGRMEAIDGLTTEKGKPVFAGVRLTDNLQEIMRHTGPGPLRDFCLTLWDSHPEMPRYLYISFQAALLSRPAAEVYETYSPYLLTEEPAADTERKKTLNTVLLRAFGEVGRSSQDGQYRVFGGQCTAEPLDRRWIQRFTQAVYTDVPRMGGSPFAYYWENVAEFDRTLMRLADPEDGENRELLIPYLRTRMEKTGQAYHYSRWLLQLGGSPRGMFGKAMAKNPAANHLYVVWNLMSEAAKVLPAEEVIALLEEFMAVGAARKQALDHFQKAIPWTIEQLRAGRPFPEWDDWQKVIK